MKIAPETPCLVTGASSGIGRDIALALGRRGCRVAVLARSREPLEELAAEIDAAGGEGLAIATDVTSEEAVQSAVQTAVDRFGGLRIVVANAGQGRYAEVIDQPAEHVDSTIQINYVGMTRTVRHALPHLLKAAPAHVVGVASSAGFIPHGNGSAYCASKAATIAYLATLRLEVKGRGVGVSAICPGIVDTPFVETAELDPKTHLPRLANWLVPTLRTEQVTRATLKAIERNKGDVVLPAMMRFFVAFRRATPRLGDWVQRVTG